MYELSSSSNFFTLTGNTVINAGKNVTDKIKAIMTPVATIFPRSRKGGASLKFILRKPIAVVMLVKKIG